MFTQQPSAPRIGWGNWTMPPSLSTVGLRPVQQPPTSGHHDSAGSGTTTITFQQHQPQQHQPVAVVQHQRAISRTPGSQHKQGGRPSVANKKPRPSNLPQPRDWRGGETSGEEPNSASKEEQVERSVETLERRKTNTTSGRGRPTAQHASGTTTTRVATTTTPGASSTTPGASSSSHTQQGVSSASAAAGAGVGTTSHARVQLPFSARAGASSAPFAPPERAVSAEQYPPPNSVVGVPTNFLNSTNVLTRRGLPTTTAQQQYTSASRTANIPASTHLYQQGHQQGYLQHNTIQHPSQQVNIQHQPNTTAATSTSAYKNFPGASSTASTGAPAPPRLLSASFSAVPPPSPGGSGGHKTTAAPGLWQPFQIGTSSSQFFGGLQQNSSSSSTARVYNPSVTVVQHHQVHPAATSTVVYPSSSQPVPGTTSAGGVTSQCVGRSIEESLQSTSAVVPGGSGGGTTPNGVRHTATSGATVNSGAASARHATQHSSCTWQTGSPRAAASSRHTLGGGGGANKLQHGAPSSSNAASSHRLPPRRSARQSSSRQEESSLPPSSKIFTMEGEVVRGDPAPPRRNTLQGRPRGVSSQAPPQTAPRRSARQRSVSASRDRSASSSRRHDQSSSFIEDGGPPSARKGSSSVSSNTRLQNREQDLADQRIATLEELLQKRDTDLKQTLQDLSLQQKNQRLAERKELEVKKHLTEARKEIAQCKVTVHQQQQEIDRLLFELEKSKVKAEQAALRYKQEHTAKLHAVAQLKDAQRKLAERPLERPLDSQGSSKTTGLGMSSVGPIESSEEEPPSEEVPYYEAPQEQSLIRPPTTIRASTIPIHETPRPPSPRRSTAASICTSADPKNVVSLRDLSELKALKKPPEALRTLFEAICLYLHIEPIKKFDSKSNKSYLDYWEPSRKMILSDTHLMQRLRSANPGPGTLQEIRTLFQLRPNGLSSKKSSHSLPGERLFKEKRDLIDPSGRQYFLPRMIEDSILTQEDILELPRYSTIPHE
ncbi:unnamed protein product [Amoebophrya sp. A25]|nr:unnamed protein product [Amoebophrya sp. A25]|eukprot:GSA25T00022077001.1